jgi:Holliday junction resolvase RusA-like endonuclease
VIYESTIGHAAWRELVTLNARNYMQLTNASPLRGAVELQLMFRLPRPGGHTGHLRADGSPRQSKSINLLPITKPDLSKLIRAIEDSLSDAGIWDDDSAVVDLICRKRYENPGLPGVDIMVRRSANRCVLCDDEIGGFGDSARLCRRCL